MITVNEAAERLGVSPSRVRALIKSGALHADKKGRQWLIPEGEVNARAKGSVRAGRPAASTAETFRGVDLEELHSLYLQCERTLMGGFDVDMLASIEDEREARFCLALSTFFLQEKQRELIAEGVF